MVPSRIGTATLVSIFSAWDSGTSPLLLLGMGAWCWAEVCKYTARGLVTSGVRISQTQLGHRERHEARRRGLQALPLGPHLVLVTVSTNARRQQPQLYRSTTGGAEWQHSLALGSDDDMVVAIDWDPSDPR